MARARETARNGTPGAGAPRPDAGWGDHGNSRAACRRPGRSSPTAWRGDRGADSVHGNMDARGDHVSRALETRAPAAAGRVPQSKELDGYDWTPVRFPVGLRARVARIRRVARGRGLVRASRHGQDVPGHRPRPQSIQGKHGNALLRRRRAGRAPAARQNGQPARQGTRHDRQGGAPGHRRARLRARRRGRQPTAVPGRRQRIRTTERGLHHEHRVQRPGTRVRRPEHGRRHHRPDRAPRAYNPLRRRLVPAHLRAHGTATHDNKTNGRQEPGVRMDQFLPLTWTKTTRSNGPLQLDKTQRQDALGHRDREDRPADA